MTWATTRSKITYEINIEISYLPMSCMKYTRTVPTTVSTNSDTDIVSTDSPMTSLVTYEIGRAHV